MAYPARHNTKLGTSSALGIVFEPEDGVNHVNTINVDNVLSVGNGTPNSLQQNKRKREEIMHEEELTMEEMKDDIFEFDDNDDDPSDADDIGEPQHKRKRTSKKKKPVKKVKNRNKPNSPRPKQIGEENTNPISIESDDEGTTTPAAPKKNIQKTKNFIDGRVLFGTKLYAYTNFIVHEQYLSTLLKIEDQERTIEILFSDIIERWVCLDKRRECFGLKLNSNIRGADVVEYEPNSYSMLCSYYTLIIFSCFYTQCYGA
jgi:hypothetical protein